MVMGKFQVVPGEPQAAGTMDAKAEEISLLVDGELEDDRVEHACSSLRESECVRTWLCYHIIGDALRGSPTMRAGLAARFSDLLDAEPTVLAPKRARPTATAVAWAAAATVAAVSVVGWVALTTMPGGDSGSTIAAARQAATIRAADARPQVDNEYLLVHQEYSPTTAIQGVRPYLRAVAAGEPDARQ
jgi:sigma-E factor negative regulatory protein RseA